MMGNDRRIPAPQIPIPPAVVQQVCSMPGSAGRGFVRNRVPIPPAVVQQVCSMPGSAGRGFVRNRVAAISRTLDLAACSRVFWQGSARGICWWLCPIGHWIPAFAGKTRAMDSPRPFGYWNVAVKGELATALVDTATRLPTPTSSTGSQ